MINPGRLQKSFRHAFRGMGVVFRAEQSFRIQVIVAVVVIALAAAVKVTAFEWTVLLLLIGAVLSLELINSVFERIVDTFKPRIHPVVRDIKDIMAATVLIVSVVSAIIGFTIFWPNLSRLF